jgi:nitrate/nitrite transporter NarK
MSTTAFTVCFAVWTIFAIIGIEIRSELGLSETQFGLLVGTPILTGSLIRVILGIWADRYGGRAIFTLTMLVSAVATWLLTYATTYPQMLMQSLASAWRAGRSRSASPMSRAGIRRKSRASRLAFSARAMSVRR